MSNIRFTRVCFSLVVSCALALQGVAPAAFARQDTSSDARRAAMIQNLRMHSEEALSIHWDSDKEIPDFISGKIPFYKDMKAERAARAFFRDFGDLFKMRIPDEELAIAKIEQDTLGMSHVRLEQRHKGVKVFGAQMMVHVDRERNITAVNGSYLPELNVDVRPQVPAEDCVAIARGHLGNPLAEASAPELMILNKALLGEGDESGHLVWKFTLSSRNPVGEWVYFVNAHTRKVVLRYNDLKSIMHRETYTLGNACGDLAGLLPGRLLIREGETSSDRIARAAHENAGIVYEYYKRTFGRNSFDDRDSKMISSVNGQFQSGESGCYANNAMYLPSKRQVIFGDGDGNQFGAWGSALDIVAHEWTHAVTHQTADLVYMNQSGALNESMSDIFGAMVDRGNWLVGEDAYTRPGRALRSMENPPAGNQPDHMRNYVETDSDNGGVHTNSGIPNKVAYLMAQGGTHDGVSVQSIGRDATEKIFYRALTQYLTSTSNFADARNAAVRAATDLFGNGSAQQQTTINAFTAVGLGANDGPGNPDSFKTFQELEPNDTWDLADAVTAPVKVLGAINVPGDLDWTVFYAEAGSKLTIDVDAAAGSDLDSVIALYSTYSGNPIAENDDDPRGDTLDSFLQITLPYAGYYYVIIGDYSRTQSNPAEWRGGPSFRYSMKISLN